MVVRYLSHALFSLESCDVHWTVDMSNQARRCQRMHFIITTSGRPPSPAGTFEGTPERHIVIGPLADALCVAQVA